MFIWEKTLTCILPYTQNNSKLYFLKEFWCFCTLKNHKFFYLKRFLLKSVALRSRGLNDSLKTLWAELARSNPKAETYWKKKFRVAKKPVNLEKPEIKQKKKLGKT